MTGIRVVVLDGLDWLWCSEHRASHAGILGWRRLGPGPEAA